jgi:hypothetical protein
VSRIIDGIRIVIGAGQLPTIVDRNTTKYRDALPIRRWSARSFHSQLLVPAEQAQERIYFREPSPTQKT